MAGTDVSTTCAVVIFGKQMNFVVIRWYKTPIIDVTSQICRDIIARLSFLNGLEAMVISAVETLNMSGAFRTVF